jgi:hypothetical protein
MAVMTPKKEGFLVAHVTARQLRDVVLAERLRAQADSFRQTRPVSNYSTWEGAQT